MAGGRCAGRGTGLDVASAHPAPAPSPGRRRCRHAVIEESSGDTTAKVLRISETLVGDSGEYICEAENDFGRAHLYAFVTVKGRSQSWEMRC